MNNRPNTNSQLAKLSKAPNHLDAFQSALSGIALTAPSARLNTSLFQQALHTAERRDAPAAAASPAKVDASSVSAFDLAFAGTGAMRECVRSAMYERKGGADAATKEMAGLKSEIDKIQGMLSALDSE